LLQQRHDRPDRAEQIDRQIQETFGETRAILLTTPRSKDAGIPRRDLANFRQVGLVGEVKYASIGCPKASFYLVLPFDRLLSLANETTLLPTFLHDASLPSRDVKPLSFGSWRRKSY
jgi:hypothetical protein